MDATSTKPILTLIRPSGNGKAKSPDAAKVRQYLIALEGVIREAKNTRDPRVLMTGLRVLASQAKNVSALGVEL